jgi:uncharacterized PurR-regulated membrane protein YhhQ (DUF165 family)
LDTRTRAIGWLALAGFLVTIPLANWTLHHFGFLNLTLSSSQGAWHFGPVASGVVWIGLSFVLRDMAQLLLGRAWAWAAIAAGVLLSVVLADPGLAAASGVAFFWSESTDALIFTPLANRGRFALGVWLSGVLASVVDSILFLWIAFDDVNGWWQLFVVKSAIVLLASPIALAARDLLRRRAPALA